MVFPLLNTIILLGSLQGFILSGLLCFGSGNKTPERILAALLFLLSLASLNIYLSESGMPPVVGFILSVVPTIIFMPFGPLIYFYARYLLEPTFRIERKHIVHFLPVVIDILPAVAAWGILVAQSITTVRPDDLQLWNNLIGQYNSYSDLPRWISITIYLFLAKKYVLKVATAVPQAEKFKRHVPWLISFLNVFLVFQAIWLVFLVPYIIPGSRFTVLYYVGYYPIYIPLAVLIYGLGIKGLLHSRLNAKSESTGIKLTPEQSNKLVNAITKAMEQDRLYLEPQFDLAWLVRHVESDQRTVSHVLNQYFLKSFNAFVNHYRIEEVKRRMASPDSEHLTLTGIAYECGFNSQSTFQRAFRQATQLTPKEYQQQVVKAATN